MKTIWKFPFSLVESFTVDMPAGSEVLDVQVQVHATYGPTNFGKELIPCIWAIVDPDASVIAKKFRIVGTGHPIKFRILSYVGTFQMEWTVWHLFEEW